MTILNISAGPVPKLSVVLGRGNAPFSRSESLRRPGGCPRDFRQASPLAGFGMIEDRVMVKLTPSSPESPFKDGRVWLLRVADGNKAWEGFSNAQGWYTAYGLDVGVEYIAVAIDPYREHKTVGAGPVVAVRGVP